MSNVVKCQGEAIRDLQQNSISSNEIRKEEVIHIDEYIRTINKEWKLQMEE